MIAEHEWDMVIGVCAGVGIGAGLTNVVAPPLLMATGLVSLIALMYWRTRAVFNVVEH